MSEFYAEYGVTTADEFRAALDNKMTVKLTPPAGQSVALEASTIVQSENWLATDKNKSWVKVVFKNEVFTYIFDSNSGWSTIGNKPEDYMKPASGIPASDLASGVIPNVPVQSVNGQTGAVVLDADDVGAQTPFMTDTITIAVADWDNGSCTKTVTGMTADALGFVKYSDTETEFTETQGTNSLTFTADPTPSEAVTVDIAWFKEASA